MHRDLKPENILCKNNVIVKICDFGSSKYIDLTGKNTPYIVSRYYRAPELMFCITKYGPPIDIWATGCILAELITRQPIFQGKTESDQIGSIFTNIGTPTESDYLELAKLVPFDPNLFREFPVIPRYLVMQQLDEMFRSVHDRKNLIDLLLKCFAYVPEQRITAADAMNHKFFDSIRQEYKDLSL